MKKLIEISYFFHPGDSARWFPKIMSVIFAKEENYKKWKLDENSVKFEKVLANSADPVKFIDSEGEKVIEDPNPQEVMYWYNTTDPMEIAIKTARKGRESNFFEKMKKK